MRLCVLALVQVLQLANCLPIVDPGLFVIMGVRSCRAGAGYCLLGTDCTLDEDFLPDDQGGHCDGLRSAFTPSAHFICCRYNAANRTISPESVPLSTPMSMGQDITDNNLGLSSDYSNTDTGGTDGEDYGASNFPSAESSEGNFVQNAEMSVGGASDLQNDNSARTETSIPANQASWSQSSSNTPLHTADNSATTTEMGYDISNRDFSDTVTYQEVLVTEGAGLSTQDDSSQSTSYEAEMSTDVYATTPNIFMNADVSSLEHPDGTASKKLQSEEQTTETSMTQFPAHIQDQSSGEYSTVTSSGDTGDRVHSNSNSKGNVKNKLVESRAESYRTPLIVLTDQGIMKAYPSVVRAETEILVHDNKTSHRNAEVQNHGVNTKETMTQVRKYKTDLSEGDERWTTNDVMEINTVSHRATTMEFHPSVAVSDIGTAEEFTSGTDNMAVTLLQSVSDNTVTSLTVSDQGSGDTTTNMEIKSGEDPVELYGGKKVLKDYEQNPFANTNGLSGAQTEPTTLASSAHFVSLLLLTATDAPISTTQNLEMSEDEIVSNISSELMSTDYEPFPSKDLTAVSESTGQFFLAQSLYRDTAGAVSKTVSAVSSDLDRTDTQFQPSKTESEIFKNTMQGPEIINEIPVTITTKLPLHAKITTIYRETIMSSSKNHDNKTTLKPLHKDSNNIDIVPALRNENKGETVMPETTESISLEMKSTNKEEFITEGFESPESGPYETTVSLQPDMLETKGISMQSNQLSASETISEHVNVLGTTQPNEMTTKSLLSDLEVSENQEEIDRTEGSDVSYNTEPAGGLQERSRTEIESKTAGFVDSDSNLEDVTEFISATPTVISSENSVTSEGTTVLPIVFKRTGTPSPAKPVQSSSTPESSEPSVRVHSSILSNSIFPAVGVTTQETSEPSSLCSIETFEKFRGTKCWLVQFLTPYNNNSSICVGSYLDSNTIVTSANCVSRVFDVGMTQVTLRSAGGAVTPHTMIRDIIVHEEYRNKGVKILLNDIGLLRLEPGSELPPAACTLCLPKSDQELMDRPCSQTSLDQVQSVSDTQIGSPMVCNGGVLAGVASYHNPYPVYTPISDYVSWIQRNQKIHDYADNEWK